MLIFQATSLNFIQNVYFGKKFNERLLLTKNYKLINVTFLV